MAVAPDADSIDPHCVAAFADKTKEMKGILSIVEEYKPDIFIMEEHDMQDRMEEKVRR